MIFDRLVRPLLFHMKPEVAHRTALWALRTAGSFEFARELLRAVFEVPCDPVTLWGLYFGNRIGLAAGFDKDAEAIGGAYALGFGHVEVGTVTPSAQTGDPHKFMVRLDKDSALVNRLGFPSKGLAYVRERMENRPPGLVVGVNIGKQSDTPLEEARVDYWHLLLSLHGVADYLAINISSPNTKGLRKLQRKDHVHDLLSSMVRLRDSIPSKTPLLVKISPDLDDESLANLAGVVVDTGIDGIIATNTTSSRPGHLASKRVPPDGGLSGEPLTDRSTKVIWRLWKETGGKVPIIGVGGVDSPRTYHEKLDAGASLVQLYTSLVYKGPGVVGHVAMGW